MGCGTSRAQPPTRKACDDDPVQMRSSDEGRRLSLYGRSELPPELSTFELREKAESIFIMADKDHDGRLNLAELRDIMHRPEMAEQVLANYMSGQVRQQRGGSAADERVSLEEFLAEVKRTYDLSSRVAEKMLFIYERTLKQRIAEREEPAAADDDVAAPEAASAPEAANAGMLASEPEPLQLRNEFGMH